MLSVINTVQQTYVNCLYPHVNAFSFISLIGTMWTMIVSWTPDLKICGLWFVRDEFGFKYGLGKLNYNSIIYFKCKS